jgi:hypothetical protein
MIKLEGKIGGDRVNSLPAPLGGACMPPMAGGKMRRLGSGEDASEVAANFGKVENRIKAGFAAIFIRGEQSAEVHAKLHNHDSLGSKRFAREREARHCGQHSFFLASFFQPSGGGG